MPNHDDFLAAEDRDAKVAAFEARLVDAYRSSAQRDLARALRDECGMPSHEATAEAERHLGAFTFGADGTPTVKLSTGATGSGARAVTLLARQIRREYQSPDQDEMFRRALRAKRAQSEGL